VKCAACLAAAVLALAGCATVAPSREPSFSAPIAAAEVAEVDDAPGEGDADLPETAADTAADAPDAPAEDVPGRSDLPARLAARARTFLGQRGPFRAAGERFNGDCSGFVAAVFAAEGIDLLAAMQRAAPDERRGARAAWLAAKADGGTFGAEGSPEPGDLVFWHDTYDQNRNRKADDRFTHIGIVERVEDGSVHFLHRGGKAVARGVMTLARRHVATDPDGERMNSTLRARSHPVKRGGPAAELFAGFGRIGDPSTAAGAHGPGARAKADVQGRRTPAPKVRSARQARTPARGS
jgi:probable lipoprotein NlpC